MNLNTYSLHNIFPVHILPFVCATFQRGFDLSLDFLTELGDELYVHVCFEKRGANIFKQCVEYLL